MINFLDKKEANKIDHSFQKETVDYLKNKNKYKCFCCNCNNDSVKSHAISKKSSLQHIADDKNKVLSFIKGKLYSTEGRLKVTPSDELFGVNEATTFKGFCTEHEKLFSNIDLNGIETKNDLVSQIYRNVSYAYWKEKFIENIAENKCSLIRNKIIEDSKEKDFVRMYMLKDLMENLEIVLYNSNDYAKLSNDEIFELKDLGLTIFFKRINLQIPLAMLNDFGFIYDDKTISNLFFSVIPYKDSTDIIMFVDAKSRYKAYDLWVKNTQNDLSILNLIESMMIKSEFWFINPDIINLIDIEKRNCLELDIRYGFIEHALNFEYKYDMSIFDDLRLELIKKNHYDDDITKEEILKINNIPERECEEFRESKLTKAISSQYIQTKLN